MKLEIADALDERDYVHSFDDPHEDSEEAMQQYLEQHYSGRSGDLTRVLARNMAALRGVVKRRMERSRQR